MWVYSICVTILLLFLSSHLSFPFGVEKCVRIFFLLCLSLFRISTFKLKSETKMQYFYILYYICLNFFVEHCVVPLKKYIYKIYLVWFFFLYTDLYMSLYGFVIHLIYAICFPSVEIFYLCLYILHEKKSETK